VSNRLRHPLTAWRNHRQDLALRVLVTALVIGDEPKVEHEELRGRLGWSARRFDTVTDLAVDLGFVEYSVTAPVPGLPDYGQVTHYFTTHDGRMFVLHGRRER
jgi:hypothetical protein